MVKSLGGEGKKVEIDETLIGGKSKGQGNKKGTKTVVIGMLERDGDVMTQVVDSTRRVSLIPPVTKNVEKGTEVHTDYLKS